MVEAQSWAFKLFGRARQNSQPKIEIKDIFQETPLKTIIILYFNVIALLFSYVYCFRCLKVITVLKWQFGKICVDMSIIYFIFLMKTWRM